MIATRHMTVAECLSVACRARGLSPLAWRWMTVLEFGRAGR